MTDQRSRRDEMKKWMTVIMCCLIIATVFVSCSETITNPNTPGSGLLNRDVVIKDDTLFASYDSTFLQRIAPDSLLFAPLQRNLVGKNGNYTAYAAVRFYPPARDTINVLSAKFSLQIISRQGDATGTFAFNAYKINSEWSEQKLNWIGATAANFYDNLPHASYSSNANPDTETVSILLDTAMVREWYKSGQTSYGIILVPTAACNVIRGFWAFEFDTTKKYWPKLEVIAKGTSATAQPDTTAFQVGADTYVADVNPFPIDNQKLYTQAGIVYRSKLKFDISKLPSAAIINSAELLLERDPANTHTNQFSPSSSPSVHAVNQADSVTFESTFALGSLKSGNTFTFDVRRQVQLWENGANYGLILRQPNVNEFNTLDLFTFYGTRAANPALRPRIIVKYTVFQN